MILVKFSFPFLLKNSIQMYFYCVDAGCLVKSRDTLFKGHVMFMFTSVALSFKLYLTILLFVTSLFDLSIIFFIQYAKCKQTQAILTKN